MKKKLILTLAFIFVIGVAATAFAAAPTQADYIKELNDIKARMAELEKKLGAVQKKQAEPSRLDFNGSDLRMRWYNNAGSEAFSERVRLNLNYKINDTMSFHARWRLENENVLGTTGFDNKLVGKDGNWLTDAYITYKDLMGAKATVGRFPQKFGAFGYWLSEGAGLIDGVKFDFGNKLKVNLGFANFGAFDPPAYSWTTNPTTHATTLATASAAKMEETWWLNLIYPLSKQTTVHGMLIQEVGGRAGSAKNYNMWGVAAEHKFNDYLTFLGDYIVNTAQPGNPSGLYLSLRYGKLDKQKLNSWRLSLDYRDIKNGNMFQTGITNALVGTQGKRGPYIGWAFVPAKNVVFEVLQTFNSTDANSGATIKESTRVQTTFSF